MKPRIAHLAVGFAGRRAAAIIVALCFLSPEPSPAEVVVQPPGSIVMGKTIAEWSTNWWRWGVSMAPPGDPFTDYSGQYANVNQSGPVFFLAGSPGGTRYRRFQVPTNTYVMLPLLVGEYAQSELGFDKTAAQIRQAAQQQADHFDSLHATLDGVPISSATLFTHRVVSPDFSFSAVFNNQLNVPPGNSGIAVADGYFVMLAPLSPGVHVLTYGGGSAFYGISISETDTITVGDPPVISLQPTNRTVPAGQSVTMAVAASGTGPLTYQWYYNSVLVMTNGPDGIAPLGRPISNATSSTNTVIAAPSSAGYYWVTVSNIVGRVSSEAAKLAVLPNDLSIRSSGGAIVLNWGYPGFALQSAPTIKGSYTNLPGAASPYTHAITGSQTFFRLIGN